MKFIVFCSVFILATLTFANTAANADQSGFTRCFQMANRTVFFDWDPFTKAAPRSVSYFDLNDYVANSGHLIKTCADWKYLKDIPPEILKPLHEIESALPENVKLSLKQVVEGGNYFHKETTATDYIANRRKLFQPDKPEVLSRLRFETGDTFAAEVMRNFIPTIVGNTSSCESFIGSCDYYLCQEKLNPCGLDGYNLSFGYKYCSGSRFKLFDSMTTELGKKWVNEVFQCLQKKSEETFRSGPSCSTIHAAAYDSHPECYVQAGFCNLPGLEKQKIFSLIKSEILSKQTFTQGLEILKQCLGEK